MRPPKTGEDKRDCKVEIRLTAAEKSTVQSNALEHGCTVSDYVRENGIGAKPLRRAANADRQALIKLLGEANKIGSNINQIARALNRRNEFYPLEALTAAIAQIDRQHTDLYKKLMEALGHGD